MPRLFTLPVAGGPTVDNNTAICREVAARPLLGHLCQQSRKHLAAYSPGCLQRVDAPATGPGLASNPCPSMWLGMRRSVILWRNSEVGFFLQHKMTEIDQF